MNWSFLGVLVPTLCYLVTAAAELHKGHPQMALVFLGYSLANVGFLWAFWVK